MTFKPLLLAAAAAFSLTAAAQAQPVPEPDAGRPNNVVTADSAGTPAAATSDNWIGVMVYAYDGREAGRIEHVVTTVAGGPPTMVQLRVRGKQVEIPTGSLRLEDGRAISALSLTQIEASTPRSR